MRRSATRSSRISDSTTLMAARNFNEQPLDKSWEPDHQEIPVPPNLSVTFTYAATFPGIPAGRYRLPRPRNVSLRSGISLIEGRYLLVRDFCGIATIKKRQTKRITANLRQRPDEIPRAYRAKKEKIGGEYTAISSKLNCYSHTAI